MITEDISLKVDDIDITGRLYLPDNGRSVFPAICISHGLPSGGAPAAGDGGYPLLANQVCERGYAVFIYNFRGCGTSGGNLDMAGWMHDLSAAIDFLYSRPETDNDFLVLIGFSAGAAISVCTAARDSRATAVIACSCPAEFGFIDPVGALDRFRRIGTIRDEDFPVSVSEWAEGFRTVSPVDCVQDIAPRPLAVIHGEEDEVVDISHAHRIFDKAGEPKEKYIISGAGHKLRNNEQALDAVFGFLDSLRR